MGFCADGLPKSLCQVLRMPACVRAVHACIYLCVCQTFSIGWPKNWANASGAASGVQKAAASSQYTE